jgi:hypothetical protein
VSVPSDDRELYLENEVGSSAHDFSHGKERISLTV